MEVKTLVVGRGRTNTYVIYHAGNREASVIDPGGEAQKIIDFIDENRLQVKNIFLTHGHFDHILAVQQVKAHTGARVVIHKNDAECLESAHRSLYLSIMSEPFRVCKADITLSGGEKTLVGGVEALFVHTPGHTPGSMCIFIENMMFSGDTLFAGDTGRTDLPGGDAYTMRGTLRDLYYMSGDYIVFPGHGEPTTLGIEREHNSELRQAAGVRDE
jgi:hydroxyacylglutathione hydrolase